MTYAKDLARYAAIFAADAGPEALYHNDRCTDDMAELCVAVAGEAIKRRDAAVETDQNFYACAFVEAAAQRLNAQPAADLGQLLIAGQAESDSIAGFKLTCPR